MPVFDIRALPQREDVDLSHVLRTLCTSVADVAGLASQHVWGTWLTVPGNQYVEGNTPASVQPASTHPPLVRLSSFEGKDPKVVEAMLRTAADVLVRELSLDEGNVFIVYDEARSGHVYSGGDIVTRGTYTRESAEP
ncbi:MAG: hypothetical protein AAGF12_02130 [Myxococcota bacterium]